ncbi:MAG: cysteine desulfurase [Coprobacillus sp.]|nr:cysteine desulfurase [Coprobacillus sp.]
MEKNNKPIIYLDNAASTKPSEEALNSFTFYSTNYFANPSAKHKIGLEEDHILDSFRQDILDTLKLKDHTVIFTSGATEANNLAIKGACLKYKNRGKHIITSKIEHPSVLEVFRTLERDYGYEVTYLDVDSSGAINLDDLKKSLRNDTIFVSLFAVNNEVGSVNPIEDIAKLLKEYPKIIFHVDAAQSIGKVDIDFTDVDMITISSHKIHGLKGSGALIKRKKIALTPILDGGGQEEGERSGTIDIAGAAALATSLKIAVKNSKENHDKVLPLAKYVTDFLAEHDSLYVLNSKYTEINPYIINFSLLTQKGSVIVEALSNEGIMVSTKSSCHAKSDEPSYVIEAMTGNTNLANDSIRISLSYENNIEEIEYFCKTLMEIVEKVHK